MFVFNVSSEYIKNAVLVSSSLLKYNTDFLVLNRKMAIWMTFAWAFSIYSNQVISFSLVVQFTFLCVLLNLKGLFGIRDYVVIFLSTV